MALWHIPGLAAIGLRAKTDPGKRWIEGMSHAALPRTAAVVGGEGVTAEPFGARDDVAVDIAAAGGALGIHQAVRLRDSQSSATKTEAGRAQKAWAAAADPKAAEVLRLDLVSRVEGRAEAGIVSAAAVRALFIAILRFAIAKGVEAVLAEADLARDICVCAVEIPAIDTRAHVRPAEADGVFCALCRHRAAALVAVASEVDDDAFAFAFAPETPTIADPGPAFAFAFAFAAEGVDEAASADPRRRGHQDDRCANDAGHGLSSSSLLAPHIQTAPTTASVGPRR
jgi:hypothetical protein